jgi:hypothetical protein
MRFLYQLFSPKLWFNTLMTSVITLPCPCANFKLVLSEVLGNNLFDISFPKLATAFITSSVFLRLGSVKYVQKFFQLNCKITLDLSITLKTFMLD